MSGRRAKQLRRLLRIIETDAPERHKVRLPRLTVHEDLLGWSDNARRVRLNHEREYARRRRQALA